MIQIDCDSNAQMVITELLLEAELLTVDVIQVGMNQFKAYTTDGNCPECGKYLSNEEYTYEYEDRPYGDATAVETITTGLKCLCGYEEEF